MVTTKLFAAVLLFTAQAKQPESSDQCVSGKCPEVAEMAKTNSLLQVKSSNQTKKQKLPDCIDRCEVDKYNKKKSLWDYDKTQIQDFDTFNCDVACSECSEHSECPGAFCTTSGECDNCTECHFCRDGIDGNCGDCGCKASEADGDYDYVSCSEHSECPGAFCTTSGECDDCTECHFCHDGIDGNCGDCGCKASEADGDYDYVSCSEHSECPGAFCTARGVCDDCTECHVCRDGIDGNCGDCGDDYPLYEDACNASEATLMAVPLAAVSNTTTERSHKFKLTTRQSRRRRDGSNTTTTDEAVKDIESNQRVDPKRKTEKMQTLLALQT